MLLAILLAPAAEASSGSVVGMCPDGSVFIVGSAADIPCRGAKQMEAHEVPPLRPEYLPRPYTWEVYERGNNPNNPYNLIDDARRIRALREAADAAEGNGARPDPRGLPGAGRSASAPSPSARAESIGLADSELQALFEIVAYAQDEVPAFFVKETAGGEEVLRVSLAHSRALEARVREQRGAEGPVLAFSAVAQQPATFADHLTFVQDHLAFRPRANDSAQMGILQGRLGELGPGEAVLGYVVLPPAMDLSRAIDVYWNDRQRSVIFRP